MPGLLDIYVEDAGYNPLARGSVSHTLPAALAYPWQSANPGL